MIVAPPPAQTAARVVAAAQAQALAQLIGGGVAEARVTSVAEGNLARLLLNGTSVALTLPTEAEVAPGDRLAVRLSTTAEGQPSIELRRLAPGQAAGPSAFDSPASRPMAAPPAQDGVQPALTRLAPALVAASSPAPQPAASAATLAPAVSAPPAAPTSSAASAAPSPLAARSDAAQSTSPTTAAEARAALQPALRDALARQSGLPALFARLGVAAGTLDAPTALRAAAARILARQVDPQLSTATADLKRAVEGSGVFLESDLAKGGPGALVRGDLKMELLALRPLLRAMIEAQSPANAAQASPASLARPPESAATDVPLRPPLRGEMAPLQAAPDSMRNDAAGTPDNTQGLAQELARSLMKEVDGALDRVRLMQLASLPDGPAAEAAQPTQQSHRQWQVEIPLMTPQGAASLPLMVERDGGQAQEGVNPDATWRMRFALDTPQLGHLDVAVSWRAGKVDIRFWADHAETADMIQQGQAELSERLLTAALPVEAIRCQQGRAAPTLAAQARQGRFLDMNS